jgi:sulfatase maturation enzyme AslB (radical SAM superfamily)
MIRLGFRCNQRCRICWQPRSWGEPPADLVHLWLTELSEAGVRLLSISGGEPTMSQDLPGLIERASGELGMRVHLQTNAIRLAEPGYAGRLRRAGLASLLVSFHSADPEISDRMTRTRGSHSRTVEGIRAALHAGLWVALNCCVERANLLGLEDLAGFVADRLVLSFPDNPVRLVNLSQPSEYLEPGLWERGAVALDEARPHLMEAARRLVRAGVACEATGSCGFPLCTFRDGLELLRWRGRETTEPRNLASRPYAAECAGCAARELCMGVRERYQQVFGGRGLVPFAVRPRPGAAAPAACRL